MSVIGELLVEINGDNSGLKNSLSESGSAVTVGISKIVSAIGLASIAWKAVDLAMQGIDYNKAAEQAEIAFKSFLGSATAAKDMIEKLRNLAKETPLEFAEVRDAAKQLSAFGISAGNLIPTMRMLADVSAGLNIPVKDLAYLFGTIQTQGKAMTVDLMQFANRGIPIWEALAIVTGKSNTELRKMVEAGQIGFPEVEKAFQNMTSEGGKFFNMATKQMESLTGSQSNLNDAFDVWLGHITEGLSGPLKDLSKWGASFFSSWVEFDKNASKTWDDINAPIDKLVANFTLVKRTLSEINNDAKVKSETWAAMDKKWGAFLKAQKDLEDAKKKTKTEEITDIGIINKKIEDGIVTEEKGLTDKINLRQKAIEKAYEDFQAGKLTKAQLDEYVRTQSAMNRDNLASLALKKTELEVITGTLKRQEEARIQYGQDAADKLQEIWDAEARVESAIESAKLADIKKKEDAHIQYGQDAADRLEKIWNAQKTPFSQIEIGLKSLMPKLEDVNDRWIQIGKDMGNALISVGKNGLEQIGRSLVDGSDAWKAWEAIGLEALAKVLEGLGAQLIALAAVNAFIPGMQGVAIAQGAAGAAALVAAGAMGAFASSLSSTAKQGEDAALAIAKTASATDLLSQAIERAKSRIASTSDTSATDAKMLAQANAIRDKYASTLDTLNIQNKMAAIQKKFLESFGADTSKVDSAILAISKAFSDLTNQMNSELDAIGYSLALFQDRAAQAGSSISSSLTSALTDGLSVTDFRKSIMDMLRKMAIDAAIIAGGFADKFKEIGNMVAEALKDGVLSETELASIDLKVNALYSSATSAIQPLNDLFNKASSAQNVTNNAGTTINIQTTNDPLTIANALSNVQQSLAYQGVVA